MAGVHGLQHIERLGSSALADDDAVGALAQRVDDELLERDLALTLVVGGTRLQRQDMALREVQLGRVLDRDDALAVGDVVGQGVEQRCLTRARATLDDDVHAGEDECLQEIRHVLIHGPVGDQRFGGEHVVAELADVECPVLRDTEGHGVDAAAVERCALAVQHAVAQRALVVAPAAVRGDDARDGPLDMFLIEEVHARRLDLAAALDHHLVGRVDHDFGHVRVPEQLLDGAELEEVVNYVLGRLALDALVLLGEGGGAVYVRQCAVSERIDAVGHLTDERDLVLKVVRASAHDLGEGVVVFPIEHGYSSGWTAAGSWG